MHFSAQPEAIGAAPLLDIVLYSRRTEAAACAVLTPYLPRQLFKSAAAIWLHFGAGPRLQSLCIALAGVTTLRQTADVIVSEMISAFGAAAGALYLLVSNAGREESYFVPVGASNSAPSSNFASSGEAETRLPLNAAAPLPYAARRQCPLFLDDVTNSSNLDTEQAVSFSLAQETGAVAALPFRLAERIIGGMELRWPQTQTFDSETQAFLEALSQLCAQALERARLYEAEQAARQMRERAEKRAGLLQSITARLTRALSAAQVAEVIVDAVAEMLGAHRGVLALLTPDGAHLEVARALGYRAEVAQVWQRFPLDAPIPLSEVTRTGSPVWIHDLAERDARYPAACPHSNHQPCVCRPASCGRQRAWAISFGFDHARAFDDAERAFIETITQQCAQALERARLHDATAQTLAEIETLNARLRRSMAETHHRVKNNLQVISALVELQSDPATTQVPADSLRRIGSHARALATLHDLLTDQAKAGVEINVVSARALLGKMVALLQTTTGDRHLEAQIDELFLPVRIGASLCLLINELVSNAIKHGGQHVRLSLTSAPMPTISLVTPPASSAYDSAKIETDTADSARTAEMEAMIDLRMN